MQGAYTLDVRSLDPRIRHIRGVVFLAGFFEPTVLIVFEPVITNPAYVAAPQPAAPGPLGSLALGPWVPEPRSPVAP